MKQVFLDAGGSREGAGRVYGNTAKTIMQNYELANDAKSAAPYIEEVQNRLFSSEKVKKVNEHEETPETA